MFFSILVVFSVACSSLPCHCCAEPVVPTSCCSRMSFSVGSDNVKQAGNRGGEEALRDASRGKFAPRVFLRVLSFQWGIHGSSVNVLSSPQERTPGSIQLVLAVLVFWSWMLLLSQLPALLGSAAHSSSTTCAKTGRTARCLQRNGIRPDVWDSP